MSGIDPFELSRWDDPDTSHDAAEFMARSGKLGAHMRKALALVLDEPGKTAREYDAAFGSGEGAMRKRLNDLAKEKIGLVRKGPTKRCSRSGLQAATWWPVKRDPVQLALFG